MNEPMHRMIYKNLLVFVSVFFCFVFFSCVFAFFVCFFFRILRRIFDSTSKSSMSQEVLIASRSSEYFHLDRSCFCRPFICCWARTFSDLCDKNFQLIISIKNHFWHHMSHLFTIASCHCVQVKRKKNRLRKCAKNLLPS